MDQNNLDYWIVPIVLDSRKIVVQKYKSCEKSRLQPKNYVIGI